MVRDISQGDDTDDEGTNAPLSRRRLLRASTTTIGGLGIASTASAHEGSEPCEQVVPDLAIVNRDDRPRTVSVSTDDGRETRTRSHRRIRIDPGATRTIDRLSAPVDGGRVRVAADEDEPAVRGLSELLPDTFRHGIRITIDSGETHAETQHADLPPMEYDRLLARCDG